MYFRRGFFGIVETKKERSKHYNGVSVSSRLDKFSAKCTLRFGEKILKRAQPAESQFVVKDGKVRGCAW